MDEVSKELRSICNKKPFIETVQYENFMTMTAPRNSPLRSKVLR